jgi:hypothetical protein
VVASGVHVRASVHVTARSYTYLVNEINRIFLEAITRGGLDPTDFASQQSVIENGLRTWVTLRQLEVAYLEIYEPASGRVRARIDLNIEFVDGSDEFYETDIERVQKELDSGGKFAGCRYRVIVSTAPGAASVAGWSATTLGDVSHLTRHDLNRVIHTSRVGASMSILR